MIFSYALQLRFPGSWTTYIMFTQHNLVKIMKVGPRIVLNFFDDMLHLRLIQGQNPKIVIRFLSDESFQERSC